MRLLSLSAVVICLASVTKSVIATTCADILSARSCKKGARNPSDKPCGWHDGSCVPLSTLSCTALTTRTCHINPDCIVAFPMNKSSRKCIPLAEQAGYSCSMYKTENFCSADKSKVPGGCAWDPTNEKCIAADVADCALLKDNKMCQHNKECTFGNTPLSKVKKVCHGVKEFSAWTCSNYGSKDKFNCNKDSFGASDGPCFFSLQKECKPLASAACEQMDKVACMRKSEVCSYQVPINERSSKCISNADISAWKCSLYTTSKDCDADPAAVSDGPCFSSKSLSSSFECKPLSSLSCGDITSITSCEQRSDCTWHEKVQKCARGRVHESRSIVQHHGYSSGTPSGSYSSSYNSYWSDYTYSYASSDYDSGAEYTNGTNGYGSSEYDSGYVTWKDYSWHYFS